MVTTFEIPRPNIDMIGRAIEKQVCDCIMYKILLTLLARCDDPFTSSVFFVVQILQNLFLYFPLFAHIVEYLVAVIGLSSLSR